jgi:hypothetical protein
VINKSAGCSQEDSVENDLIFAAETDDALIGPAADTTQIAAAATPSAELLPMPRETAKVVVPQGETVVHVPVAPGEIVELPFPADAHFLARLDDGNLAIKVGDLTIILQGYAEAAGQTPPVIEDANGQPLDIAAILAATDPSIEIETAAGPAGAQGQGADNTGALLTQFAGAGGGLGGFTGAGGQEGSDTPGSGPGVDQNGTLFKQFGDVPTPTAPNALDANFTTDEESKITGKLLATDPQGDVLTYSVVGAAPAGLTLNPDGSWSFDPVGKYDQLNTDHPGQISFQYKANDGVHDSNTATVTIDIAGINDVPKSSPGFTSIAISEDSSNLVQPLHWNVTDPDDTDITITVDKSTLPSGVTYDPVTGSVHFDTLGQYDYLAAGEAADFKLKFTIADAHGGSIEQTLDVAIIGQNDAPVAADDIVLTNAGLGTYGVFFIPDWALLINDKDVDSTSLEVSGLSGVSGLDSLAHHSGGFLVDEDDTLGASFSYLATDGSVDSNLAAVGIHNQQGGDITGTDADEILIGGISGGKLDGGGGNDIILTSGGSGTFEIFGGAGDDIVRMIGGRITQHGGTDSVASSGGLAADAANHGDVMIVSDDNDLATIADKANVDGIETVSTEAKFGVGDPQTLTLNAASVQQLSDHTITPGGGFGEHEAIRIDGDSVDQVYLSQDGGKWVDTGIEMVGYRVYAHETTAGDPASTDAYVMVQAANTGNVHLNPPIAVDDLVLTTVGTKAVIEIPEWALLANDTGGPNLDVSSNFSDLTDLNAIVQFPGVGSNGTVDVYEDGTLGGSFKYQATDDGTLSKAATVSITNSQVDAFFGGDADEIMVGRAAGELLAGGGGNDIIFGGGGFGDRLYGEAGDDVIEFEQVAQIHGGTDGVAPSGGLAGGVDSHGDVLITAKNLSLVDAKDIDGVETISTQEKFGGTGAQLVTIDAASVQQLSDHTITPGGGFGEHEAIRIDGDTVDQLYLAIGKDGGQWVDTSIVMAGYHIYAHETTDGEPASTDAYVMVQAANTANVHLNQDGAPVAVDDIVLTNRGTADGIFIPEWALVANDKSLDGASLDVEDFSALVGAVSLSHDAGVGSNGTLNFDDDATFGGSFDYTATDGSVESKSATVTIHNQSINDDLAGTDADEILVGNRFSQKIDGGGGNDIIFGGGAKGGGDVIFGGAGDDTIMVLNNTEVHGGTDNVASSGGLAAGEGNHGDRMFSGFDLDLDLSDSAKAAKFDGIETISTEEKFGATDAQTLTISAASVRQLSDHTITPGGGFGEHEAIRIDGDSVDEVILSGDAGKWVDTAIEMVGYHVYAHETTAGDPASTDAYVMVQAANVGNVQLNLPVAHDDRILTTVGTNTSFSLPEWALLANDTGGPNLDVAGFGGLTGLSFIVSHPGVGTNGSVTVAEDGTPGGSFTYQAIDDGTLSKEATVSIFNSAGADLVGTNADEILVGSKNSDTLSGGGGNDIIFGGHGPFGDQIHGGDGDDIIELDQDSLIHGDADSVALSGGLAASAGNHGDVLIRATNVNVGDALNPADGIETISTQEKFGGTGAQIVTIDAASVRQLSDHTITPGGGFAEHEAIRIDGDLVDQLYLTIDKDGGQWVDTAIAVAGYHVYAHETTGGDPASTDAYVMVQAANTANVHLNQDGAPVAVDDIVLTNRGTADGIFIPEWALVANDKSLDGASLDVEDFNAVVGAISVGHDTGVGSNGSINFSDDATLGGSFDYTATDGSVESKSATVAIQNQNSGDLTGTDADEILIGNRFSQKIDGGGGNDIIFGSGAKGGDDLIFGGAGDDTISLIAHTEAHGGTDNVASSGGLAAGAGNHGDRLIVDDDLDLSDAAVAAKFDGIETISTEAKFDAANLQTLTISAASVQQLSDHTITPGGGFGEHDAIRIDGDSFDQVNLSASKDGGQWIDTSIELAGYHVYAHETTGGDKASTDAYVMVQAANVDNVHLQPVAANDIVLTNVGTAAEFFVPEWALLANDTGTNLDVSAAFFGGNGLDFATHNPGTGSNGEFEGSDEDPLGGTIEYKATDGFQDSAIAIVAIQNQDGGDITGTDADEILIGEGRTSEKIDGGGGNDILFGGNGSGTDEIFGGAGDDTLQWFGGRSSLHGGTDSVASSGGLAAAADHHGDVLVRYNDWDLADSAEAAKFDGIESLSTEGKFGAVGAQTLTIGAGSVQQLSDHTITPGGVFAEHEAIRIDGDFVDQLYLSISKDGGKWVDTAIETAGYHIFAHETTAGDAASTDAYVMVQAGNTGNVTLNQDAP